MKESLSYSLKQAIKKSYMNHILSIESFFISMMNHDLQNHRQPKILPEVNWL